MSEQDDLEKVKFMSSEAPPDQIDEITEPGEKVATVKTDWKTKLNARIAKLKSAAAKVDVKKAESTTKEPMSEELQAKVDALIVPGDPGKPQNETEALVELDREIGRKATEQKDLEKKADVALNAEALFDELVSEREADRDRFKQVFVNVVGQCLGMNLDELADSIRRDHEMLYDLRTGVQAKLALRRELLKDATSEERAKRMKEDLKFKTPKRENGEAKAKGERKEKKAPFDPLAAIRSKLQKQGLSEDEIKKRLAKFGG